MLIGSVYAVRTSGMLTELLGKKEIHSYSVNVLKDDPAESIEDTKNYKYGYVKGIEDKNTNKVIDQINRLTGKTIETVAYDSWQQLSDALLQKKVQAVIFNEEYRNNINECNEGFSDRTKVIKILEVVDSVLKATKKTKNEPFLLYISGNDDEGAIRSVGRSDVNIIACVNPTTRQILLISTPRDYYIMIDNLQGMTGKDKLTHAGIFGVQGSITALQNLYQIQIDYYVKVNFTGTVAIVNALGGITVDSDVAFTTTYETAPETYDFVAGKNECDGDKALAFCRERKAFGTGDFQRGRNQLAAIHGIFNKATSPAIIMNYMKVMNSVSDSFATNMPTETISALVKDILNDSRPWNIQSYAAKASGTSYEYSTCMKKNLDMDIPDEDSVQLIHEMIEKVMQGEDIQVDELTEDQ